MYHVARLALWITLASASIGSAQNKASDAAKSAPPADRAEPKLSVAEQITRLERAIEKDHQLLSELRKKLETMAAEERERATTTPATGPAGEQKPEETKEPKSEFAQAKAQFRELDEELTAARKRLENLNQEENLEKAEELKSGIQDLENRWKLAKERFDLAIQERKALQEQIAALEAKIKQDRQVLQKLQSPATQPAEPPAQPPATAPEPAQPPAPSETTSPGPAGTTPVPTPAPTPSPPAEAEQKPPSKEVQEAQKQAQRKEQEAKKAEQQVQDISEQIKQLDQSIANQKELLQIATSKMANARETEQALLKQLQTLSANGADPEKLREVSSQMADARERRWEYQKDIDRSKDEIQRLQAEKARLQSDRIAALEQARKAREETEELQKEVEWLQNPFAPRNLLQFLIEKGPKVGGIFLAMLVLLWIVKVMTRRVVETLSKRADQSSRVERENRARTLASVFQNAASIAIVVGGILMILQVLNVPIAPILGGAAVFGLAIAFGAQNLIRDYFTGFMILLENQYGVNDVVKICDIGGLVERVTLRMTVLRDLEGVAHFIPNGQITTVSNMTHVWSRALFDIGVAYKESVDEVMRLLVEIGREMRQDSNYSHLILEDPEMLGVDQFGDSAVVIKFFMKTRPLQQWTVKREMLRRIKNKFDELGIEIPFPHRTVFHRAAETGPFGPDVGTG